MRISDWSSDVCSSDRAATTKARTQHELQGDAALARILRNAVDAAQGDDGWSHLGAVGSHISNQGSFDSRNYGYRKLSDLIEATGLFEVRKNGQLLSVRSEEHTSELQSLMRISYAVFCLKKKNKKKTQHIQQQIHNTTTDTT